MLCRMEGLLYISYKLYPCSYILVRCLSTGVHTQFVPGHLHFLELPENDRLFP